MYALVHFSSGMLLILISQAKNQWTEIYVCKGNRMQATCVVNDNLQFSYLLLTWLFLWAEIRFSLKKKFLFLGNYQLPEHMCTFSKILSHTMHTFINSFAQGVWKSEMNHVLHINGVPACLITESYIIWDYKWVGNLFLQEEWGRTDPR